MKSQAREGRAGKASENGGKLTRTAHSIDTSSWSVSGKSFEDEENENSADKNGVKQSNIQEKKKKQKTKQKEKNRGTGG